MIKIPKATPIMWTLVLMIASGCNSRDDRLVKVSERAAERQKEQNDIIARQSETVTVENQRITEAAKELVTNDAEARQEMVRAQRDLHQELHAERSSLDRQREEMEQERRDLAERRGRDPIIAETIRGIGTLLVCLVPLIVAAYALSRLDRGSPESEELGEFLIRELLDDRPVILPPRAIPTLGNRPDHPPAEDADRPDDEPDPADTAS